MSELGDYKVRCDRCFREAAYNNRSAYAVDHPFLSMLLEDPFIRDEWEQKQIMKDVIEMQKELEIAAKEGRKVKRY